MKMILKKFFQIWQIRIPDCFLLLLQFLIQGGNVELTCTIQNGKEYPILWMRLGGKREPFPISTGPSLLVHDKRFSLENDPETGSYILSIREVQKTDEAR